MPNVNFFICKIMYSGKEEKREVLKREWETIDQLKPAHTKKNKAQSNVTLIPLLNERGERWGSVVGMPTDRSGWTWVISGCLRPDLSGWEERPDQGFTICGTPCTPLAVWEGTAYVGDFYPWKKHIFNNRRRNIDDLKCMYYKHCSVNIVFRLVVIAIVVFAK